MPLVTLNLTERAHLVYRGLALTRSASETVSIYLESLDKQAKRRFERQQRGLNISKAIRIQFGDAAWALYSVDGTIPEGLVME
jgi:hypothetical protein